MWYNCYIICNTPITGWHVDALRQHIVADFEKAPDATTTHGLWRSARRSRLDRTGQPVVGNQRRPGLGLPGRTSGDRAGDPASLRRRGRAGSVELPAGSVPARPRHPGLCVDDDVRQHPGRHRRHRTRQARALVRDRHPAGRRAVPGAGPGTDRMGAHLHPVDDHAGVRTHEKAAVSTGARSLPGGAGADRPNGRRRVGAHQHRRTRRLHRAGTSVREVTAP